jgi:hypothetical protein
MFYHISLYLFNLVPLKVYILTMDTTRGVIDKLAFIALIAYLNKQIFLQVKRAATTDTTEHGSTSKVKVPGPINDSSQVLEFITY